MFVGLFNVDTIQHKFRIFSIFFTSLHIILEYSVSMKYITLNLKERQISGKKNSK